MNRAFLSSGLRLRAQMNPPVTYPATGHFLFPGVWLMVMLAFRCAAASPAAPGADTAAAQHWAFVAPHVPALPRVKRERWVRNEIDRFVLARLEKERISPSPEADRNTLIRRLHLDLLGLPPAPEQVRSFVNDREPDAYERLVDSLLASPHFGERWGRHWMDLARYADSSGYQIDRPRPNAYLFRDWVIHAINEDLPFDQFTIEQLAGDLLPNATTAQKTAAGFHRLTLMNHEDGTDAEEFRCKAKVDRVNTTGTTWLGLTLACAECHNHKYDPISQREFFQFYAFFNNSQEVELPTGDKVDPARFAQEMKTWTAEETRLTQLLAAAAKTNAARVATLKRELKQHRRGKPQSNDTQIDTFKERTAPPQAHVHIRGDFLRKGDEVRAATPAVLHSFRFRGEYPDRLDLARWLVDPANPLTARVAVNHVWQHLFGRGLVNTPEDFGLRGERPSHPELLDWLAVTFSRRPEVATGPAFNWSRKALIRLIVTSATYRQSSQVRPELESVDPQNALFARQSRIRVEAEIVRDLHLAVSGLLNDDIGGPSFRPFLPSDIKKLGSAGAFSWTDTEGPEKYRRGLYIYAQRTVPYPTSMTFDQADSSQSCPRRERSNTPLQALTLLNHGVFVESGNALAALLMQRTNAPAQERIRWAFNGCLARNPTRPELRRLERLFGEQRELATRSQGGDPTCERSAEAASWLSVSQVLLNLDEFVTRE